MKRYIFSGIENFRDLGGMAIGKNSFTKENQLYRSAMMYKHNDEDAQILEDLGIQTIIDLRSPKEVVKEPNVYKDEVTNYHNINISGNSNAGRSSELAKNAGENPYFMSERYLEYVSNGEEIKRFFEVLLKDSNLPLVFHCSAGKDRTGVISYLLLTLSGVDIKDIIADYQISYTYIKDNSYILDKDKGLNIYISYPQIMERFHTAFQERYGSTENYLEQNGFSHPEINKLKLILNK